MRHPDSAVDEYVKLAKLGVRIDQLVELSLSADELRTLLKNIERLLEASEKRDNRVVISHTP
ncbi:hypothetical protein [Nitrososphaera sp.]|uniref:hypothetical protein n=1 Tax=Nitrososphaera sp. TaxID=1971748 RepID=UPI0017A66BCA|nr:hypothetical protein [Nitrososphaera sp.]NWG37562.1 hypothetical protein [Nitrososphaera sp.]